MEKHPILQSSDILAYGLWTKLSGGNLDIFNALQASSRGAYNAFIYECTAEMIGMMKSGDDACRRTKQWGHH
jgi:hypothetical protein